VWSGAFLNQALDYLINEHKQIDDLISILKNEKAGLFDTDKSVLEKNILELTLMMKVLKLQNFPYGSGLRKKAGLYPI